LCLSHADAGLVRWAVEFFERRCFAFEWNRSKLSSRVKPSRNLERCFVDCPVHAKFAQGSALAGIPERRCLRSSWQGRKSFPGPGRVSPENYVVGGVASDCALNHAVVSRAGLAPGSWNFERRCIAFELERQQMSWSAKSVQKFESRCFVIVPVHALRRAN
jgi:hypothetical protein